MRRLSGPRNPARRGAPYLRRNSAAIGLAKSDSYGHLENMNSKHRKTLAVVFRDPVSGTIEWSAIEASLSPAGGRPDEGPDRGAFRKMAMLFTFHRPFWHRMLTYQVPMHEIS